MRLLLACLVMAPSVALADPIWCGTSLDPPTPHYEWGLGSRPSLVQGLAIQYVSVDLIHDSRARAVIESTLMPAPCPLTGSWAVTLIVAPNGTVLAATATGLGDGSCITDQLRPARFEHAPELRSVSARVTLSLRPRS